MNNPIITTNYTLSIDSEDVTFSTKVKHIDEVPPGLLTAGYPALIQKVRGIWNKHRGWLFDECQITSNRTFTVAEYDESTDSFTNTEYMLVVDKPRTNSKKQTITLYLNNYSNQLYTFEEAAECQPQTR